MATPDLATLLSFHGIKPTANRIMVAQAIAEAGRPVCLTELEDILETVDKSNIFRALTLFRENRLVHTIEDETGALHYEMCHGHCHCQDECDGHCHCHDFDSDDDLHVHFFCRVCHRMTCLESLPIPSVSLPDGFEAASASFIIKGVCPDCRKSRQTPN